MSTRLPYETKGGYVSEGETFSQLTEHLRLAEECCYTISHLARGNDDHIRADGFLRSGQNLAKMRELITTFTTSRGRMQ
jgi:hypothetical protein